MESILQDKIQEAFEKIYGLKIDKPELQATRKDFEGDITLVVFPYVKQLKKNPKEVAEAIGNYLKENLSQIEDFNVVSGFLNLVIAPGYYIDFLNRIYSDEDYGLTPVDTSRKSLMVEYSSPNTNKPLHLGHIRNNLLGHSISEIYKATGKPVIKTQIINDRGIHICKSMLAWQKFGNGETPESTGMKGDHLVGKYYVIYNEKYNEELEKIKNDAEEVYKFLIDPKNKEKIIEYSKKYIPKTKIDFDNKALFALLGFGLSVYFYEKKDKEIGDIIAFISLLLGISSVKLKKEYEIEIDKNIVNKETFQKYQLLKQKLGIDENDLKNKSEYEMIQYIFEKFKNHSPLIQEAQEMLRKWEAKDPEVMALWRKMNGWVYDGFNETYKNLGVDFDKNYYESETYLLGKKIVEDGLKKGIFYKKPDGSVWVDLSDVGLDEKLLLRADGTSVYITQDIGTAIKRFEDFDIDSHIYVVGNEQDYHFQVLFAILKKLGYEWADRLYHLSYGMVELPHGKMKSREGTVVDADDLMEEMTTTAREIAQELGKLEGYSDEEKERLYRIIGLGALKYFILKVDPKRTILFDPQKSIDFQGNTGPFIQYTYARIQSILRKAGDLKEKPYQINDLHPKEKEVIKLLEDFPQVIHTAAEQQNPGIIANYTYDLVKQYNSFYQSIPILTAENENERIFRVKLSKKTGDTIKNAFKLLGIEVPERM